MTEFWPGKNLSEHVCFWCCRATGSYRHFPDGEPHMPFAVMRHNPCEKCIEDVSTDIKTLIIRAIEFPVGFNQELVLIPGTQTLDLNRYPAKIFNLLHPVILQISVDSLESNPEKVYLKPGIQFYIKTVEEMIRLGFLQFAENSHTIGTKIQIL